MCKGAHPDRLGQGPMTRNLHLVALHAKRGLIDCEAPRHAWYSGVGALTSLGVS